MECIELERWKPSADKPHMLEYTGQRCAAEVFAELRNRLQNQGCLPEEYFLMASEWENGREIPRDADIFCTTDYGASEGVYVDVYLKWYEDGKPVIRSFAAGKTLGETGDDLDRMFLISSAVTKAFHGERASHERFVQVGGPKKEASGSVVHLSAAEQTTILDALLSQREQQEAKLTQTEQLLRRMTGSITAYMDTVGQQPLRLSAFDKAVIAIRDGEVPVFKEILPHVHDRADDLLIETAGRPGAAGRKLIAAVLEGTEQSFYGGMAQYAYREHRDLAGRIIQWCAPEQIRAAPPELLYTACRMRDNRSCEQLAKKGIDADSCFADIARWCAGDHREWQVKSMLEDGLKVSSSNYAALAACAEHDLTDAGKLLLDRGMDFEKFHVWAQQHIPELLNTHAAAMEELSRHSAELADAQEEQDTGGMTFG